jgi:hypothetical protein
LAASSSFRCAASGGNCSGDKPLKLAFDEACPGAVSPSAKLFRKSSGIISIILKKHVTERLANNLALVLVEAGLDLLNHDLFELFAQGDVHVL